MKLQNGGSPVTRIDVLRPIIKRENRSHTHVFNNLRWRGTNYYTILFFDHNSSKFVVKSIRYIINFPNPINKAYQNYIHTLPDKTKTPGWITRRQPTCHATLVQFQRLFFLKHSYEMRAHTELVPPPHPFAYSEIHRYYKKHKFQCVVTPLTGQRLFPKIKILLFIL